MILGAFSILMVLWFYGWWGSYSGSHSHRLLSLHILVHQVKTFILVKVDANPLSKCSVEIGISTTKLFATNKDLFCPKQNKVEVLSYREIVTCILPICLLREDSVPQGLLLSLISFYWWCPYCRYSPGHRATEGKAVFGTQLLCTALAAALTLNQLKIFPHSKTDNYF